MMEEKTFAIGIDLGGTSIKAASVGRTGSIMQQMSVDSKASIGPAAVIEQLHVAIREILSRHNVADCLGIGIGSPGVVDERGVVKYPPNFAHWSDVPLAEAIRKDQPMRVEVENDANAAAIAESKFGAGIDHKDFLFVIWGTGVGGGIIIDRKIFRGSQGGAGEIGHITIDHNGPDCNCGSRGCIESYIGQRYLSTHARHLLERLGKSAPPTKISELVGGNLDKIEPYIISMAAEQGDKVAREILEEAGELLGYALASALNILDLRIVVIGGGISAAPHYVYEAIESALRERVLKPYKPDVRVIRAKLGNTAGAIGAASLVM